MSKHAYIFITGLLVAILPFLGFPRSWDNVFFAVSGVILMVIAVLLRREQHRLEIGKTKTSRASQVFVENGDTTLSKYNSARSVGKPRRKTTTAQTTEPAITQD
jgi:hypothetical protein